MWQWWNPRTHFSKLSARTIQDQLSCHHTFKKHLWKRWWSTKYYKESDRSWQNKKAHEWRHPTWGIGQDPCRYLTCIYYSGFIKKNCLKYLLTFPDSKIHIKLFILQLRSTDLEILQFWENITDWGYSLLVVWLLDEKNLNNPLNVSECL